MSATFWLERDVTESASIEVTDDMLQQMHDDDVDFEDRYDVYEWLIANKYDQHLDWDWDYKPSPSPVQWDGWEDFTPNIPEKEPKPRPIQPITGQIDIFGAVVGDRPPLGATTPTNQHTQEDK